MQPGFFDDEDRLAKLEKLGDPLPRNHGHSRPFFCHFFARAIVSSPLPPRGSHYVVNPSSTPFSGAMAAPGLAASHIGADGTGVLRSS
jgi:hypothetical protein